MIIESEESLGKIKMVDCNGKVRSQSGDHNPSAIVVSAHTARSTGKCAPHSVWSETTRLQQLVWSSLEVQQGGDRRKTRDRRGQAHKRGICSY